MRFYERFCSFRALSIIGKCTSRHLSAYGGLQVYNLNLFKFDTCDWTPMPFACQSHALGWVLSCCFPTICKTD